MKHAVNTEQVTGSPSRTGGLIRIGIIGGAGYTGGELIRLLLNHPRASLVFIHSNSNAGKPISDVHQDLLGDTSLSFSYDEVLATSGLSGIDVLFICTGHGEAKKFLQFHAIPDNVKIIDLSNDFRLSQNAEFSQHDENGKSFTRQFTYGLPELNKEQIRTAQNIANPGCFATAIQLGLLPLSEAGLLDEVYTTGITGSTGAGQSLSATSHFSWRANNIQAYKTLSHQHLGEIVQSLTQVRPTQKKIEISFVPWRGDFTRGIFVSSVIHSARKIDYLTDLFKAYYEDSIFTFISKEPIFLKQVVNTNKCIIQLEKVGSKLVVHSIIDNLLKGASGQAVQNMNLMFDLDETTGLKLKSTYF